MAKKSIERYTEELTQKEMKITGLGENDFGYVYTQGEDTPISAINEALKRAGGKPKECSLNDYTKGGKLKGKPEFIITLNKDPNTIIVVECKPTARQHMSKGLNKPNDYAVDGVLYYTKFLKDYFNVIAVAVSGTSTENMKVNAYHWVRGREDFTEFHKIRDMILEPNNYLKLCNGEKVQKEYDIKEIRQTAINIHDSLRINKMTEKLKPLFIAGILIALQDMDFCSNYEMETNFKYLLDKCCRAIEDTLRDGEIEEKKIKEIRNKFKEIDSVIKLRKTPLGEDHSLRWYINQLEMKIKPMMDYVGNTIDALGTFYHEFIKYSSGDGNSLGIVLTPEHLTEFMVDLINIDENSKVIDIACGSGAFLVTAMGKMFKKAPTKTEYIRKNNLYGIEQDSDIHTLALANMIVRQDGKSHIVHGDCFDKSTIKRFTNLKDSEGNNIFLNKALLNPPYSQKDHCELEFAEQALNLLCQGGELAIVCPMSCAIGTKFKDVRQRLMMRHKLKAVFSMPDEIFNGNGASTNVCVMVWEAKVPHDPNVSTFFGYYKDDGFVKRKKLGRIDAFNKWNGIKEEWLRLYREKEVKDGITAKACVHFDDEWLCEAYMKTDYSKLSEEDFQQTLNNYLAYLVKEGEIFES